MTRIPQIVPALALALLAVTTSTRPADAQNTQMAQAAHKGTFNYLRDAPNRHSRILEKMPKGTPFRIVGASGEYYAVVLASGQRGWTFKTNAAPLK